jgi:hypothetical protein
VSRSARRVLLRVGAACLLFGMLAGPAPGNIGGCGSTNATVSAAEHCTEYRYWLCTRDRYAERIDDAELQACLAPINTDCPGSMWPAGCAPTQAQSEACIMLLRQPDLASMTNDELLAAYDDCNICP